MKENEIQALLESATREISKVLPDASELSVEGARRILRKYAANIAPHFVTWMTGAMLFARSTETRSILEENIIAEIRDDHSGLLGAFVSSAGVTNVEAPLYGDALTEMCRGADGLSLVTMIAVMENVSTSFIPFLSELVRKCGGTDFRYTNIHGVADIEHAKKCVIALERESLLHDGAEIAVSIATRETVEFFKAIFS